MTEEVFNNLFFCIFLVSCFWGAILWIISLDEREIPRALSPTTWVIALIIFPFLVWGLYSYLEGEHEERLVEQAERALITEQAERDKVESYILFYLEQQKENDND